MRPSTQSLPALALIAAFAVPACGEDSSAAPAAQSDDGAVFFSLTAAADVRCIRLGFAGSARTVTRDVLVDGTAMTRLDGLPVGSVRVTSSGFSTGTCEGDPSWTAEPLAVTLRPGAPVAITLVYRPNGIAVVSATFVGDDVITLSCSADWTLVPRAALALTNDGPAGTGLHAVYDNGEVRDGEGPIYFGPHEPGNVPSWYPADTLADGTAPALWRTIWGIGSADLTGFVVAPRTGSVAFNAGADDYVSLELGNGLLSLVADNTGGLSGTAELQAGQRYPVRLHYANRWGSNGFNFYWRCP